MLMALGKLATAFAVSAVALSLMAARADNYPSRPIRVIVPFAAGGTIDIAARITAEPLSQQLGQPIVVDNRPGANGVIGTEVVAKAAPDGHTLLEVTGSFVVNAIVHRKLPYDVVRDFAPVTEMGRSTGYLVLVHPSLPVKSVRELVQRSKAEGVVWHYSSPGAGNTMHLAAELLKVRTGARLTHVPYRGLGPAANALIAGEVQLTITPPLAGLEYVRSGLARALAFTGPARSAELPDVPTLAESGYRGLIIDAGWLGLFAPAATPRPIVERLQAEMRKTLALPKIAGALRKGGYEPIASTPEVFARFVRAEMQRYAEIVRAAKIEPE
jgi:tripartite-type tricarboxylate transporter receptor subunit TctC